jgi:transcriptional regulator with XRE-family HTH domain
MLGDELRKARLDAGMSQEKVALQAGVDRSYLSELENNRWSPTVEMLFRLCETLGVAASEILSRVERGRQTK